MNEELLRCALCGRVLDRDDAEVAIDENGNDVVVCVGFCPDPCDPEDPWGLKDYNY